LHWGVEELDADLPRAKPVSERGSGALTMEEGGRRAPAQVRRGQAKHIEHKMEKEQVWRLRESEEKVGKGLMGAETWCHGVLSLAQISAAFWD